MTGRTRCCVARFLLLALAFSHAAVAWAACTMERGTMAPVLAPAVAEPCIHDEMFLGPFGPLYANRCLAHCTSDLQIVGPALDAGVASTGAPVLAVPRIWRTPLRITGLDAPPPGTPPPRILQHAFLL